MKVNSKFITEKNVNDILLAEYFRWKEQFLILHLENQSVSIADLEYDKGYNHNFVIDGAGLEKFVAVLSDKISGRAVRILSDQPGCRFYTANWWDGSLVGSLGVPYKQHTAIALETQNFPDAPNHPDFPNSILKPGERYRSKTIYQLSSL